MNTKPDKGNGLFTQLIGKKLALLIITSEWANKRFSKTFSSPKKELWIPSVLQTTLSVRLRNLSLTTSFPKLNTGLSILWITLLLSRSSERNSSNFWLTAESNIKVWISSKPWRRCNLPKSQRKRRKELKNKRKRRSTCSVCRPRRESTSPPGIQTSSSNPDLSITMMYQAAISFVLGPTLFGRRSNISLINWSKQMVLKMLTSLCSSLEVD